VQSTIPIGGFSPLLGQLALVVVHVHLHLAKVLVSERTCLQINQDKAACQSIVEHQVDVVVLSIERDPRLTPHEGKPLSQLQQKLLELVDESVF
jgi:hypothetical protein